MSELPRLSRTLLTPGPLAPLSHFGLTLLRHGVVTALRYACHHLALPLPESPPVRLVRLRLYLDTAALEALFGRYPGGREAAAALVDPGGAGRLPTEARALAAAVGLHRLRLRLAPRRPPRRPPALPPDEPPPERWERFRREVSALARPWGDGLLADWVAALGRRAARAAGRPVPPCLSRPAWRLRRGRRARRDRFGPPDPLAPSWAEEPAAAEYALAGLAGEPLPPCDPLRGRFREAWRAGLDRLRPLYLALARDAVDRGFLTAPEEAFFLPFDVASDLALPARPGWLAQAVGQNRREHRTLLAADEPADLQHGRLATLGPDPERWRRAPLLPLA